MAAVAALGLLPTQRNIHLLLNLVFQQNNQLCDAAAQGLVLAGEAALAPLEGCIIRPPSDHIHQAMQAFAQIASQANDEAIRERCQRILIDRLYIPRPRSEAAAALAYFDDPGVVTALLNAMRFGPEWVRGACSDALSQLGARAVGPLLAYVQETGLADQGDRALRSLARMACDLLLVVLEGLDTKSLVDRFALLVANYRVENLQVLLRHRTRRCRLAALAALDELKPGNIQPLLEMSTHPDPRTRQQAIMALGNNPREVEQVLSTLRQALTDPIWRVRAAACASLGRLYERTARAAYGDISWQRRIFQIPLSDPITIIPVLLQDKISDEQAGVRVSAVRGLGCCADSTTAINTLVSVIRGTQQTLHSEAIDALLAIGGEREPIHEALLHALAPTFTTAARYRAIGGLVQHGQATDLPQLLPLLVDDSHLIRQKTAKIIRQIVWRFHQLPEDTVQAMRQYIAGGETVQRVFAAYALAFSGHEDAIQVLLLDMLKYNELPLMSASHLSHLFDDHRDVVRMLAEKIESDFGL
jgi:HEAT repeat protein